MSTVLKSGTRWENAGPERAPSWGGRAGGHAWQGLELIPSTAKTKSHWLITGQLLGIYHKKQTVNFSSSVEQLSLAEKVDVKYLSENIPHYRHAENCDREARVLSEQEADSE